MAVGGGPAAPVYTPSEETATTTRLGTGENPHSFQVHVGYMYLVTGEQFVRVPVTGGDPATIFQDGTSARVYAHATGLYVMSGSTIRRASWQAPLPLLPFDAEECL